MRQLGLQVFFFELNTNTIHDWPNGLYFFFLLCVVSQHGRYRCSRCGQDYYCSLACQRLAFPVHASECRNRYETKVLARELVTHVREITVVQLVIDFVKTQVA